VRHLLHVLEVAVPVALAAASTIAVSPAVQTHPALVAYVALVAGVLNAVYRTLRSAQEPAGADPTPGPGSSTMSAR
jgi:hypothetical protein